MPDNPFNRKDVLVSGQGRLGFAELRERIERVKASDFAESASKRPGFTILEASKTFDFIIRFLAAYEAGVPVAIFSSDWTAAEYAARAELLEKNRSQIHPEAAVVLFTSGSSGEPKAVQLTRAGIDANTRAVTSALHFSTAEIQYLFLPLSYSYGLLGQLLPALAAGVTTTLLDSFLDARRFFLGSDNGKPAHGMWSGVASQWSALLRLIENGGPYADVTHVISAGSRLSPELKRKLRVVFPRALLSNNYGQTEASPRILSMTSEDPDFFSDATGYPVSEIEVRISETSELEARGPQIMCGYLGDEVGSASRVVDGWLKTGDLGERDADGRVTIRGRLDDLVKVSGERISPSEVEATILRLGWAPEVSIVPIEDPVYGTRLLLFLGGELADGIRDRKDPELLRALKEVLSAAKVPAKILRVESLPRTPNGKIDRRALRESLKTPSP